MKIFDIFARCFLVAWIILTSVVGHIAIIGQLRLGSYVQSIYPTILADNDVGVVNDADIKQQIKPKLKGK